jgi:hypothetical protein
MDARVVARADALFEALLGFALVIGAASGGFGASDFPRPVGPAVIAVVGALLLGAAVVIWRGAVSPKALAIGNVATALAALVWLAAAAGFSTAGTVLVVAAASALVCLAAAQVATLRR